MIEDGHALKEFAICLVVLVVKHGIDVLHAHSLLRQDEHEENHMVRVGEDVSVWRVFGLIVGVECCVLIIGTIEERLMQRMEQMEKNYKQQMEEIERSNREKMKILEDQLQQYRSSGLCHFMYFVSLTDFFSFDFSSHFTTDDALLHGWQ